MSTAKVNQILNNAGTALPDNLLPVTASAWVNFNGSGTVSIRDQFNVSSITDNGTGDYTINLTTPLANANYTVCAEIGGTSNAYHTRTLDDVTPRTTSAVRVLTVSGVYAAIDPANVDVILFGGH